ncbi:major facilitator superfamily transporter, partial [Fusarium mundagurra]
MVGSFLTPMAAGTQAAHEGWRWSYYTLAICLTILSVITVFAFEETKYIPLSVGQVDNDVASFGQSSVEDIDSKNKVDGDAATIATQTEPAIPMNSYRQCMRWTTTTSENLPRLFMMPFYVITLPHVMFTALQFASGICWLVVFMQVISIIFAAPPYNFSTAGIGYMSLGPFVGNLFGSIYGGPLADWTCVRLAKRNGGVFEPEMRLYPLAIPTFFSA